MKKEKIIIGSRGSKLAIIYAKKAKDKIIQNTNLKDKDVIIKEITTKGDQVKDVRLSEVGGKGLFSNNIEKELKENKIDIAVHALKDLPGLETDGLIVDTFLERNDPREILITINKKKLKELKLNAIIGTSSLRREFQIKNIRSDFNCKLIRGNVDTRIDKLKNGSYDGIILSHAGIEALRLNDQISEIFSVGDLIPSAGQGIISLQCREDDNEILSILKKIKELKSNAIIGTSSLRREFQIKNIRTDLNCKLIRGNVDTRIKKLKDGLYDAIILSYAGIEALKLNNQISEIFSVGDLIPSAGQGIISLQCRKDDNEIVSILKKINHNETHQRAEAERNVLKVLEGDCETAVGVHAVVEGNRIILEAELFSIDGTQRFYEKKSSEIENAKELGKEVGQILKLKSNNSYKK